MMISVQQIFTERPCTCHGSPARITAFAGGLRVEKEREEKGGKNYVKYDEPARAKLRAVMVGGGGNR